jgi:hypothetical protein
MGRGWHLFSRGMTSGGQLVSRPIQLKMRSWTDGYAQPKSDCPLISRALRLHRLLCWVGSDAGLVSQTLGAR